MYSSAHGPVLVTLVGTKPLKDTDYRWDDVIEVGEVFDFLREDRPYWSDRT